MGRIHRYKQKKDVHIFNLVAENTREGMVLARVLEKLEHIKRAIGSDKVYDVIGEIFPAKELYQLVVDAVSGKLTQKDIENKFGFKVDEKYKQTLLDEVMEQGLVNTIDYKSIDEIAERTKELKLVPEYVEEFFKKAFTKAGGKYKVRKDESLVINSIPFEIKRVADELDFKKDYGKLLRSYPRITFDKDVAFDNDDLEYVSFGHPLLEATLRWVDEKYSTEMQRGGVFKDPSGTYNGIFWFFEGLVNDGKGEIAGKKLFAIYDGEEPQEVNPSLLWDFVPVDDSEPLTLEEDKSSAESMVIESIEEYLSELRNERERQANVKRKYGLKSLEYLIGDLDANLTEYEIKKGEGVNMDLAIRNAYERKKGYLIAAENLKKEIDQETHLSMSKPKLLGAIFVDGTEGSLVDEGITEEGESVDEMRTDKDIELIGMEVSMEYETLEGRKPVDISKDNLGFDVRSKDKEGETRYIEVKARKGEGSVALTKNEWIKARRFKDQYWLYVVANAVSKPLLYIIQNPANFLEPTEKMDVRYLVFPDEWKRGKKVFEKDN